MAAGDISWNDTHTVCQGCGYGPFWPDPDNFHRIRIRIRIRILSVPLLWQCNVVKTWKNILKIDQIKIIIQIPEEICLM